MFNDKEYISTLIRIALPISIQNLVSSSLNMVGVLMIGQMGETSVAAVGLANQIFFVLNLMLFGICSGSAIFTAQYWGKRDISSIRKVLGIAITLSLAGALVFTLVALLAPGWALSLYSKDPAVVALGSRYLRIVGLSYLFFAVSFPYAVVLRSTGEVKVPMYISASALSLNALLSFTLIFGKLGVPAMGVPGAAVATVIARSFELVALLVMTYRRNLPAAASLHEMFGYDRMFLKRILVVVMPVAFNETLWSMGVTVYNMVYARIGTEAIAAVNISSTIESLAFVVFIGISNASAIMIGHQIGSGNQHKAFDYARRALLVGAGGAVIMGAAILLASDQILNLYKISDVSRSYAHNILIVMGCALWIKVMNMTIIVGVLRSGGDTRFSLFLDAGTVFVVGIPMALLGAFVLHLPVYFVVPMVLMEEVVKVTIGMTRFISKKWINNLAETTA